MNEDRTTKKAFNAQLISTRRKGASNLRWIDDLDKYILVLRTSNSKALAGVRLAWKRLLKKTKAHLGCRTNEEGRSSKKEI
ncbi:hypothetical protein TNCV_3237201 [Trichonephila clavipes]|nr:hypothetical protein TNCV_3237201 [Trichonephila clavipes]